MLGSPSSPPLPTRPPRPPRRLMFKLSLSVAALLATTPAGAVDPVGGLATPQQLREQSCVQGARATLQT